MSKIKIDAVTYPRPIPNCKPIGMEHGLTLLLLISDFIVYVNGFKHIIPAGFVFDGASIPWGMRNTFNPTDTRYMAAALIHDYLYEAEIYPRLANDAVFLAAMIYSGQVPRWKYNMMYAAVVIGGGWSYRTQHSAATVAAARGLLGIIDGRRPMRHEIMELVRVA
jgi:hypothetical protein